ncbi:Para-Rep C1, partial [Trichinella papuae]
MTYQWARQGVEKNVVVDIERRVSTSHYDGIYSFIEMVKNRVISNTKYRSVIGFMREDVHVVVVTNVNFDDTKITKSRMCLHDLSVKD